MSEAELATLSNYRGRAYYVAIALWAFVFLALFWQTLSTMVQIWVDSETYTHGFLIVPISVWLLRDGWHRYKDLPLSPSLWPLLVVLPASMAWFLATLVGVQVVQQFAAIVIFIGGVAALVGLPVTRQIGFALLFLLFCVPMGQGLVPPMIDLTADATVSMVKLTGIPIYREGTFFSLPSGNWSVVAACSGVRYLIASVTLGCLYAYITYQRPLKRLGFIALSIIVPVLANLARAFLIVMIGHFSNMQLATGVDHLIYGWVFFGVVMAILFWLGSLWRDDVDARSSSAISAAQVAASGRGRGALPIVFSFILASAVVAPLVLHGLNARPLPQAQTVLQFPDSITSWRGTSVPWSWQPRTLGAHSNDSRAYRAGDATVAFYVGHYLFQREGAEVIDRRNRVVAPGKDSPWRLLSSLGQVNTTTRPSFGVNEHKVGAGSERLLVWSWYRVGDRSTNNAYVAKFYDAINRLFYDRRDAARLYIATSLADVGEEAEVAARHNLHAFLNDAWPPLALSLDRVAGWDND